LDSARGLGILKRGTAGFGSPGQKEERKLWKELTNEEEGVRGKEKRRPVG